MKKINKVSTVILSLALILGITGPMTAFAVTAIAPDLGTASTFSVLGVTLTADGSGATISGDLGATTKTGTWTHTGGTDYIAGAAAGALSDATDAWTTMGSTGGTAWNPVTDISPAPGLWTRSGDATFSNTLTLNGSATDVWIFQISDSLTFTGTVNLTGEAQACNVFWRIASDATINSGGAGSVFVGTLIANGNVSLVGGVTVNGRIMALNGTLSTAGVTNITGPTCATPPPAPATLHVVKTVINNNGGTAVASDFTLNVTGTNVSNPSFAGSASGVDITLDAGSYAVTEPVVPTGYLQTGSGDCSGTIAAGETKTCTVTNDDIAPQLIVNKVIINDNSGTKVISDFPLFVDGVSVTSGVASTTTIGLHTVSETSDSGYTTTIGGNCAVDGTITLALGDVKTCTITNDDIAPSGGGGSSPPHLPLPPLIDVVKVPSPLALPDGTGSVTYTYTLRNIGTVPVTNITMVGDTCSPITLVSGDTNADARLAVDETWIYTCSTTLSKTHTNIVTAIGWANGISATDIANATVVVGVPIIPPLIHVVKVPNVFTLSAPGGAVTYTYIVTNPGTEPLSNVNAIDDKCTGLPGRVVGHPGDINKNDLLESNEAWSFTCKSNLTKTTTNTATASGEANGLIVRDFAIATVVVSAASPKLPDTGFSLEGNNTLWNIIIPASIFAVLILFYFTRRKQTV